MQCLRVPLLDSLTVGTSQVILEHHGRRQNHRQGVGFVGARDVGGRSVAGLENPGLVQIAKRCRRQHAEGPHQHGSLQKYGK